MTSVKPKTDFNCSGTTTAGLRYSSISAMWDAELSRLPSKSSSISSPPLCAEPAAWYTKSALYWERQAPSIEGMLGGLGLLDPRDVAASRSFLRSVWKRVQLPPHSIALDVGAGIGRVTKHLLLPLFPTVDMLEQNQHYLQQSKAFILQEPVQKKCGVVAKRISCGMQSFDARGVCGNDGTDSGSLVARYGLVWIQWCIIYLTDDDLISFLKQCCLCLVPGGLICLKDNVVRTGFVVDKDDSSIMRSGKYLKHLFAKAHVEVVRESKQLDFPRDVFPVRTYALRPIQQQKQQKQQQPKTNMPSIEHLQVSVD